MLFTLYAVTFSLNFFYTCKPFLSLFPIFKQLEVFIKHVGSIHIICCIKHFFLAHILRLKVDPKSGMFILTLNTDALFLMLIKCHRKAMFNHITKLWFIIIRTSFSKQIYELPTSAVWKTNSDLFYITLK